MKFLIVERPDNTVDTLVLSSNTDLKPVAERLSQDVKGCYFKKMKKKVVYDTGNERMKYDKKIIIKIYEAAKVYEIMEKEFTDFDLGSLKKWRNLNYYWQLVTRDVQMVDYNRTSLPFRPYDFQPRDVEKMLRTRVMLNANDMGCGKTLESVLTGESIPLKKLVICPATLRLNWEREILMVNPDADVKILYSNKPFEVGKDWTIIGYPSIKKFQKELEKEGFQCIFADEAHYCMAVSNYGEPSSDRAKGVLRLCATSAYVFPLTGTPKPTRSKDIYNLLRMIRHPLTRKEDAFWSFAHTYCNAKKTKFGLDINGSSNDFGLNKELAPYMVRHLKREVLPDLKKIRSMIPLDVNLKEFKAEMENYRAFRKSEENKQAAALTALTKAKMALAKEKVKDTIDFANDLVDVGQKVVIVTCFTEVVEKVSEAFEGDIVKVVGGMSDKKKQEAIMEFQEGDKHVLVMNIIAGGVGITLTAAHYMIFNDFDWTVGNITQAEDRICRGGQKECCLIYYMTARKVSIENYIINMLTRKEKSINNTVDGGNGEMLNFDELLDTLPDTTEGK